MGPPAERYVGGMEIRVLSADDVRAAISMAEAIDVMEAAFRALSAGRAEAPLRHALESEHGVHLFMPAHVHDRGALGAKIVSVNPENPDTGLPAIHAVVVTIDPRTGRPLALLDGTWLTALRTGAVGGLAARLLSRADSRVVALFGASVQARTQLEAVRCARDVEEVRVVSRTAASAERLVAELEGVRAVVCRSAAEALAGADIVVTATDSATPVFDGGRVEAGTHVTAVGSFTPEMREVDTALVRRARIFVDQLEAALAEAGDLAGPIADGDLHPDAVLGEIGEVAAGLVPGRLSAADVTYFKSVGNAVQDVAVAARVLEVAGQRGLGVTVEI